MVHLLMYLHLWSQPWLQAEPGTRFLCWIFGSFPHLLLCNYKFTSHPDTVSTGKYLSLNLLLASSIRASHVMFAVINQRGKLRQVRRVCNPAATSRNMTFQSTLLVLLCCSWWALIFQVCEVILLSWNEDAVDYIMFRFPLCFDKNKK